ncbi:MAG TPA: thioesterase family protein [Acidimicrobiales bacterium]|nr:thioesterase family protein [Acidimicrobiales bacterium]
MDARHFLGLERGDDGRHWRMAVTPSVSTPGHFLYGGCALAAGLVALEEASGRPTVWATAQYLSYAPTGTEVEWEVVLAASGRNTTQGRAIARLGEREILTVNAALGSNDLEVSGTWVEPPDVPAPDDCPLQEIPSFFAGSVLTRVEHRVARGRLFSQLDGQPGDAHSAFWARLPGQLEPSAATLAVIGDYVSGAVSQPLGRRTLGRSLDNTLRVARLVPTGWVLCDIRMHALAHGFAQGEAHLWAEDGTLLGTASQSISVRLWTDDTVFVRPTAPQETSARKKTTTSEKTVP